VLWANAAEEQKGTLISRAVGSKTARSMEIA
jgi:hypothetical protein